MSSPTQGIVEQHHHKSHKKEGVSHPGTPYERAPKGSSPKGVGADPGSMSPAKAAHHHHARHHSVSVKTTAHISITEEKQIVFLEIYGILATKYAAELPLYMTQLNALAAQVKEVHPFAFLLFVQENPTLKGHLNILKASWGSIAWIRTQGDFSDQMAARKHERIYFDAFLAKIETRHHKTVQTFFDQDQFRELLNYFLES